MVSVCDIVGRSVGQSCNGDLSAAYFKGHIYTRQQRFRRHRNAGGMVGVEMYRVELCPVCCRVIGDRQASETTDDGDGGVMCYGVVMWHCVLSVCVCFFTTLRVSRVKSFC